MTGEQFKSAIAKLGLSQERAGRWLGISGRQAQRYAGGSQAIPEPTAKLIRLMLKLDLKPEDVS